MMGQHEMRDSGIPIDEFIDSMLISRRHMLILAVFSFVAILDGYDIQALSFVAPILVRIWRLHPSEFGPIFSAGLLGLMTGQLILPVLSDRYGRRFIIIGSVFAFGAFTLMCGLAENLHQLLVLRFLGGVGLGSVTPNIIALAAEITPSRVRSLVIATILSCFSVGAVAGGYVSSQVIAGGRWQIVFFIGGILPLCTSGFLLALVPESPMLLARRGETRRLKNVLKLLAPKQMSDDISISTSHDVESSTPIQMLFGKGNRLKTGLVWITFLLSLFVIYSLASWAAILLSSRGLALGDAIMLATLVNVGGGIGGVVIGRLLDRFDPRTMLAICCLCCSAAMTSVALSESNWPILAISMSAAGVFSSGMQVGLTTYTASIYSAESRSTAIGSALACGRVGAIIGPSAVGALLAANMPANSIFLVLGAPSLVVAAVLIFSRETLRIAA